MKKRLLENAEVLGLSYKGHAVATHPEDEREIHILGAVPGDVLDIEIYKKVKDIYYADMVKIKKESPCRTAPREGEVYKSTSPWQIFKFNCENKYKKGFVEKFFKEHAGTTLDTEIFFPDGFDIYNYRNKIEYGFWRNRENGKYSFSFFKRGSSRGKIPILESALNHQKINGAGKIFLDLINQKNIDFGVLKYLILRYSYFEDKVVAHLIIQKDDFEALRVGGGGGVGEGTTPPTTPPKKKKTPPPPPKPHPRLLKGIKVSYSPPETPGARVEKDFLELGNLTLKEKVAGKIFEYGLEHFFQVYVPLFDFVIDDMKSVLLKLQKERGRKWTKMLDFFAGVGLFGIALSDLAEKIEAVEVSEGTKYFAETNAQNARLKNYKFIETDTDNALESLKNTELLILDPPRAGVPKDTIKAILQEKPETIIYLSCNPKTQAMDYNWLKRDYKIIFNKAYNLFPRTPHVENLVVLKRG